MRLPASTRAGIDHGPVPFSPAPAGGTANTGLEQQTHKLLAAAESVRHDAVKSAFLEHRLITDPVGLKRDLAAADFDALRRGSLEQLGFRPLPPKSIAFGVPGSANTHPIMQQAETQHRQMLSRSAHYRKLTKAAMAQGPLRITGGTTRTGHCQTDKTGQSIIVINPEISDKPEELRHVLAFELGNVSQAADFSEIEIAARTGKFQDLAANAKPIQRRVGSPTSRVDNLLARNTRDHASLYHAKQIEKIEYFSAIHDFKVYRQMDQRNIIQRAKGLVQYVQSNIATGRPAFPTRQQQITTESLFGHTGPYMTREEFSRTGKSHGSEKELALRSVMVTPDDTRLALQLTSNAYRDPSSTALELRAALQTNIRAEIVSDSGAMRQVMAEIRNPRRDRGTMLPAETRAILRALNGVAATGNPEQRARMEAVVNEMFPDFRFIATDKPAFTGQHDGSLPGG